MVRVANTGISGVIDPYGRVMQSLSLVTKLALLMHRLPVAISKTIYARYGNQLFLLIFMLLLRWADSYTGPQQQGLDIHIVCF